jgi:hypothetical protein
MSSGLMDPLNPIDIDIENQVIPEKPILRRSVAIDYEYQLFKEDLSRSFRSGWDHQREEGVWGRMWIYFTQLWERVVDN